MMPNIKNLVLEGGGVKGIAYAGAIEILEKANLLKKLKRVAGTSAGAITATLLSLQYSAKEIAEIVTGLDLTAFEDKLDPLRVVTKYGLYKGEAFLDWIKEKIHKKGFDPKATFKDLHKAGCKDLYLFATDLSTRELKEFSYEITPNAIVAEAVRSSMSIPLFFEAWKFTNKIPDDHIYVDGGVIYNFPLPAFDYEGEPNQETLGLHLDNLTGKVKPSDLSYDHILGYVKNLFDTMLEAQAIDFEQDPEELSRTIRIDDLGISATDFKINAKQKQKLFDSGKQAALNYLKKNGISIN